MLEEPVKPRVATGSSPEAGYSPGCVGFMPVFASIGPAPDKVTGQDANLSVAFGGGRPVGMDRFDALWVHHADN